MSTPRYDWLKMAPWILKLPTTPVPACVEKSRSSCVLFSLKPNRSSLFPGWADLVPQVSINGLLLCDTPTNGHIAYIIPHSILDEQIQIFRSTHPPSCLICSFLTLSFLFRWTAVQHLRLALPPPRPLSPWYSLASRCCSSLTCHVGLCVCLCVLL